MIVILGGGLAGLTAAYKLSKKGKKVILIEKNKDIGGLASSFEKQGEFFPLTYHHVMISDKITQKIIKELKILDKLYFINARMIFNVKGKEFRLSNPLDILKFKHLTFLEKIKFAFFALKIFSIKNYNKYNSISAKDFVIKYAGLAIYKKIFEPLLKTKFSNDAEDIAANWLIYRLSVRESSGRFGYLYGGINLLISRLKENIEKNGGKIVTNAEVKEILIKNKNVYSIVYIKNNKKRKIFPKKVISTLPVPIFISLCKGLPKEYTKQLKKIKYKSSISVVVGLNKKITENYWINFLHNNYVFGGIFDHSNLNKKVNNGKSILYLFTYLNETDKLWKMDGKSIIKKYLADLEKIFPNSTSHLKWTKIFKLRYSKPIYLKGYNGFKPKIRTPINNLYIAGILLFPLMRHMGSAIKSGLDVAKIIK